MQAERNLKVAVLMGGVGGERRVSLESGKAVADGLAGAGHEVIPYEVSGRTLPGLAELRPDAAFVALHGAFGEDGGVQELLERMGIPYTGSGPEASRLGMDKLASKRLFVRHAIPTADYFAIGPTEPQDSFAARAMLFGFPLVCKPAASGSSLGVSIVRHAAELPGAVALAREHGETALVERYVRGREFTVGVLEGAALPMVELQVAQEFFNYRAKYEDDATCYITPVALLPTLYRKASEAAVRAYEALGCRHMARVDLLYGYDGGLYVLEVNTIPGFTPRSLLPMAAGEVGIPFPALCERLVRAALRDAADRNRRRRRSA
ncbi:MAG: D-alanine--D-alanine ligase family protein [Planctomycetota bacterium]|jgi:D-alanine-D-alanine ligase